MHTTLIADDEPDMLLMVRLMMRVASDGIEILAEASDGAEAVRFFEELGGTPTPHVVILDNRMPEMSGLEAAAAILAKRPDQPIVLYSAHLDDRVRADAAKVGIRACLHKDEIDRLPEIISSLVA